VSVGASTGASFVARAAHALRRRRDMRRVAASGLFLPDWYLEQNRDVRLAGIDPLIHFLEHGGTEGRDPHPLFDCGWYLWENPAVRAAKLNPLVHYLTAGAQAQRDPCPLFDTAFYLRQKPDLDGADPLTHYLRHGAAQGLDPHPLFDSDWYLEHYPAVAAKGINPLLHYVRWGAAAGLNPSARFDAARYLADNPDVRESGVNPLLHYLQQGKPAAKAAAGVAMRTQAAGPPVPLLAAPPLRDAVAKVIAFYLPQFHPIPENDAWWGRGFTEWTNVTRATAQFVGHHQPHLPGELGFYDLRLPDVQRRQIELAKLYGIGGFCFYFYWFAGKRLLELPLEQYLAHPEFDLPFCLCWANENWTRRWDGLESDILIQQDHSPGDDVAFISYLARYFHDPRYIRIGGKPLLVVYRPHLLPAMVDTAARWRDWCRGNGVGEIFLAYAQSFEAVDPKTYGLDAAIEFPPNSGSPPEITADVDLINRTYRGRIFDWTHLVEQSEHYAATPYTLFRGVCPSWDNEARRPGQSSVLYGSSPAGYLRWLENAVADTVARISDPDARLVFVNSWNEWAEGAHIEPDRRHGYAYLEATRMALVRAKLHAERGAEPGPAAASAHSRASGNPDLSNTSESLLSRGRAESDGRSGRLAVVVHAFYPDIFAALVDRFDAYDIDFTLFATTSAETIEAVRSMLESKPYPHEVIAVENRGRDVAPFLQVARRAIDDGFGFLLKLHTKKSPHMEGGEAWREELYGCLADGAQAKWILSRMRADGAIGLVSSAAHIVPLADQWGQNRRRVEWLAKRMGVARLNEARDLFMAGTMFFARAAALAPLLNLAVNREDFEPEDGRVDGTMAHALERAFVYSARAAGFAVAAARIAHGKDEEKLTKVG
jgi:lipopolysaccharide biosynthesis protein